MGLDNPRPSCVEFGGTAQGVGELKKKMMYDKVRWVKRGLWDMMGYDTDSRKG